MSGYIGAIPTPQATQSRDVYTATSNQTTFTTQGYTPNFVSVYLNGVHLARADFTATNGSDVVLASGATADDVVEIVSFGTFQSADALPLTGGTMTGDLIVPDGDLILGSTAVTSTAAELNILDGVTATTAELNIMDGVTSTAAEINLIDGGTARGTTAVADGDGLLINDAGTMRMTNVQTVKTYMTAGVGGGGMEFIASSGAISNAANVSFTQFDASKYDAYRFMYYYVKPVTDNVYLTWQSSTDNGSSYDTSNGDYKYGDAGNGGNVGFGYVSAGYQIGNAAAEYGMTGWSTLIGPNNTTTPKIMTSWTQHWYTDGNFRAMSQNYYGVAIRVATTDIDAIRFAFSSGNITSGEITMFGIVNS